MYLFEKYDLPEKVVEGWGQSSAVVIPTKGFLLLYA